jgi:hypothetical protein
MKTDSAIDVAHLLRDTAYFPEKQSDEREKIVPPNIREQAVVWQKQDVTIVIPKARGSDPHPWPGRVPNDRP